MKINIGNIKVQKKIEIGNLKFGIKKVYPELEDLEVTPTTEEQNFKSSKYGYNEVKVKALESEEINIVPSTEEQIKEGLYKKVTVAGDENLISENIKEGTSIFGVEGNAKTTNIKITDAQYLFYNGARTEYLQEILKLCDNLNNTSYMYQNCVDLIKLDLSNVNTSKVVKAMSMFNSCARLKELNFSNFDMGNASDIRNMFGNTPALIDLKSFKNLGKGYYRQSNNYNNYKLDLSSSPNLSYESLMDIITNGLYDLNLTYDVANGGTLYTQQLVLGSTNLAKLTSEEITISTNKGWTVS